MVGFANLFDSLFLIGKSDAGIIIILHPIADKMFHFGYTHFTEEFIAQLKMELPKIVEEANKDHNLDLIEPAKLFKTRMEKEGKEKFG